MSPQKLTSDQRAAIVLARRKARQKAQLAMNREMSKSKASAGITFLHGRVDEVVAAARLAEIPPDTRNLTQRVCGDPVFERSALYRRLFQVG